MTSLMFDRRSLDEILIFLVNYNRGRVLNETFLCLVRPR